MVSVVVVCVVLCVLGGIAFAENSNTPLPLLLPLSLSTPYVFVQEISQT